MFFGWLGWPNSLLAKCGRGWGRPQRAAHQPSHQRPFLPPACCRPPRRFWPVKNGGCTKNYIQAPWPLPRARASIQGGGPAKNSTKAAVGSVIYPRGAPEKKLAGVYIHKNRGGKLPCVFSLQLSWGFLLPSEERREVHKTKRVSRVQCPTRPLQAGGC